MTNKDKFTDGKNEKLKGDLDKNNNNSELEETTTNKNVSIKFTTQKCEILQNPLFNKHNLIQKFKTYFIKSLILLLNILYKNISNKNEDFLQPIDAKEYEKINKEKNNEFLRMTVKELMEKDVSEKRPYNINKDFNKTQILKFNIEYQLKEEGNEIKNILNTTIKDMLHNYNNSSSKYSKEFSLEIDLQKIKNKMLKQEHISLNDIDQYIQNMRTIAKDFAALNENRS